MGGQTHHCLEQQRPDAEDLECDDAADDPKMDGGKAQVMDGEKAQVQGLVCG
jgi:hypothetical protein